jgi:3-phenylpropionate/trans-cinnamate dioxygenase ferredoxin reductase subunit
MRGMVIIGAGECGVRAAFALREAGYGGPVTLIGEEPHLPYERPPLSKTTLVTPKPIADEARYADARIDFRRGLRAERLDPVEKTVELSDGSSIAYEKLLMATGATARRSSGMEAARTLRTIDDAHRILGKLRPGSHLGIVGGGFIGLELAATARSVNAQVTVVEAANRLMARVVPVEIAAVMEARHRTEGVDFNLGAGVQRANETQIELADGRVIDCDIVVAGVGAVPNVALARAAGLSVNNGVVVDETFRTSAPDIYAAGDCCMFPYGGRHVRLESWRAAQDQANHAAAAMLGRMDVYNRIPWFWSDQYDLTLQVAGLPDATQPAIRRELGKGAFVLFQLRDDGRLVSACGIGTGNAIARDIRLAEMIIERGSATNPQQLADPSVSLKSMLKGQEREVQKSANVATATTSAISLRSAFGKQ